LFAGHSASIVSSIMGTSIMMLVAAIDRGSSHGIHSDVVLQTPAAH
jgi:hypothetical protein